MPDRRTLPGRYHGHSTDDPATFDLLKKAETTAVFQPESRGMKDLIRRLLPDCFEDIVAPVALFRPGPLQSGMVDDFINRKHGRAALAYPHPDFQHEWLQPVLQPTYGIILYQEQVMQIAQVLAGYSLGGADLLRRAMGKKKPEEMAKQKAFFWKGALKNDIKKNWPKRYSTLKICWRFQQVPLGSLCPGVLPDRVAENAFPSPLWLPL